jgi:OmcA/MtrC family decaheme c-type cytochrome
VLGLNYQGFVKLDHPDYPKGIRLREPAFAMLTATGHTARRTIVDSARCNNCHDQLGVEPSFHSGARNNPQGCAIGGCHNETKSTGHTGEANDYGGGWALSAKSMIHGIHGASKRTQAFNYEATAKNLKGFGIVAYPGVLNNCEQCHVPGSYTSATRECRGDGEPAVDHRCQRGHANPNNAPSIGLSPWINILGKGQIDYRGDPLVSSPITSACFGCHDSPVAVTHFQQNGGILLQSVSSITGATPGVPGTSTTSSAGLDSKNVETSAAMLPAGWRAQVVHRVKGVQ